MQKNIPEVELKSRGVKLRIMCSRSWKETFSKGMSVEVKRDKEGCYGSWHTAAIVESVGYDKFLVEYQKLKTVNGSQFLKEEVDASCIRPCPPEIQSFHQFEHLDRVDAWLNDGWWEGHIKEVLGGLKYIVCLMTTEEELVFEHSMLRPRQEWVKEKWFTAREVCSSNLFHVLVGFLPRGYITIFFFFVHPPLFPQFLKSLIRQEVHLT